MSTSTPLLFGLVLALLASLSADLDLLGEALADESVLGLELLGDLEVVVDEAEASALASTELCLEAEDEDGGGVGDLEHLGEKLLKLLLGDVVAARVDHVDDLNNGEKSI